MGVGETTFGDLLRRHRVEAGLTQEALAERAGLSTRVISDLERGITRSPYRATVMRLVEALGLDDAAAEALAERAKGRRAPRRPEPEERPIRSRVPQPLTPILGREREVGAILHLLRWEGKRLVTLTGTGGVGKTRVGLQVAEEARGDYADGAVFVSLAAITEPALVPTTIAGALGIQVQEGGRVEEAVERSLEDRELLLVLDNFEQVLEAGPFVAELLSACPRVKALATSREPLHLRGEQQMVIEPLPVPEEGRSWSVEELRRVPSVALFTDRAKAVQASFALTLENGAAVSGICRGLDGLPLALELAAAQVKEQSPVALHTQLEKRLDLLRAGYRDVPARQQTMRDTIAWSYELLEPEQQRVFRSLSVFAGGFTPEAAEAVVAETEVPSDAVQRNLYALVDKSLVQRAQGAEPRFSMLETIREYGLERLSKHEEMLPVQEACARYFVQMAEQAQTSIGGPDSGAWVNRFDMELDNLRAVLVWAKERDRPDLGLRLYCALDRYWLVRAHLSEALQHAEDLLESGKELEIGLRARALGSVGAYTGHLLGDSDRGSRLLEESLVLARQAGEPRLVITTILALVATLRSTGDDRRARSLLEESYALAESFEDKREMARVLRTHATFLWFSGEAVRAAALYEEALPLFRELGDIGAIDMALRYTGRLSRLQGDSLHAQQLWEEALALSRSWGDKYADPDLLLWLSELAWERGDRETATELWQEVLQAIGKSQDRRVQRACFVELAWTAVKRDDASTARNALLEGIRLGPGDPPAALVRSALITAAEIARVEGRGECVALFGAAAENVLQRNHPLVDQLTLQEARETVCRGQRLLRGDAWTAAWRRGQDLSLAEALHVLEEYLSEDSSSEHAYSASAYVRESSVDD